MKRSPGAAARQPLGLGTAWRCVRLFVGMPVPGREALERVAQDAALRLDVRPVPTGSWHVTLRFLGEMEGPAAVVEALDRALAGAHALPCRLQGVGAFSQPRRARILWAGIEAPGLEELAAGVVEATRTLGQPPEARDFRPHVTLARARHPLDARAWVEAHAQPLLADGWLETVVLYRSEPGPAGARYEAVRTWPLDPPSDPRVP